MNNKTISNKRAIFIILIINTGEGVMYVQGIGAGKDLWIAMLLTIIASIPLASIFARLHSLYKGNDLFEIIEECLGKPIGKVLIALYTIHCFQLLLSITSSFGYYVNTTSFTEINYLVPAIVLICLCTYSAILGADIFSEVSEILVIFPILIVILSLVFLLPKADVNNVLPAFTKDFKVIGREVMYNLPNSFTPTINFMFVYNDIKGNKSPYKVYIYGTVIAGVFLLIISFLNIAILGEKFCNIYYYPTYVTLSKVRIGTFLQRAEIIASLVFLLACYLDITIWLIGVCKGIKKLFNLSDYKILIIPVSILTINFITFYFKNIMGMFAWFKSGYTIYAILFQIIIPLIILIISEIKIRVSKRKNGLSHI